MENVYPFHGFSEMFFSLVFHFLKFSHPYRLESVSVGI